MLLPLFPSYDSVQNVYVYVSGSCLHGARAFPSRIGNGYLSGRGVRLEGLCREKSARYVSRVSLYIDFPGIAFLELHVSGIALDLH